MAFLPLVFPAIPFDTAKAARAASAKKNFYLAVGDQVNPLFDGIRLSNHEEQFMTPHMQAMLYLVTVFQYMETLPDLLAVKALKERVDWKYALHLPPDYPGMEASLLSGFHPWLDAEPDGRQNLNLLIRRLSEFPDCPSLLLPCPDAEQVLSEICQVNKLAQIWEAIAQVMEALGISRSERLLGVHLPIWYMRYNNLETNLNLGADRLERHAMFQKVGADGFYLLKVLSEVDMPGLSDLPEISNLRQVWEQQYEQADGKVRWRRKACL
jgi:hypothetical protein